MIDLTAGSKISGHYFDTPGQRDRPLKTEHKTEHKTKQERVQLNQQALNRFLSEVERRAYRMAEIATGNPQDALDLVQDAMLGLVKSYAHKNETDWGPLFHRMLQNRIRDWYRRNTVRNKVRSWSGMSSNEDEHSDPIQTAPDPHGRSPEEHARNSGSMLALDNALKQLPLRQQQAFLLRNWECLDVAQTAIAMGCSQSSVKTHYARAVKSLRVSLTDHCGESL
ncbi:RNA polymerase sigma-70 factor [hydrothermal vent metagenome]|uniref:RNA polymerase sigma-70 factor n=1 Tax=hydrothermal vent metagenome TaxID=652676 RepID=A0A3B0XUJ6_9ZZZZ